MVITQLQTRLSNRRDNTTIRREARYLAAARTVSTATKSRKQPVLTELRFRTSIVQIMCRESDKEESIAEIPNGQLGLGQNPRFWSIRVLSEKLLLPPQWSLLPAGTAPYGCVLMWILVWWAKPGSSQIPYWAVCSSFVFVNFDCLFLYKLASSIRNSSRCFLLPSQLRT